MLLSFAPISHYQTWMQGVHFTNPYVCACCWRARVCSASLSRAARGVRHASKSATPPETSRDGARQEEERGALSRRLAQMSEESLETGGKSARKAVEEAGFSDDLKRELEEKIANASFRSEHASAFAQATMPSNAGRGTRDTAAARPWTGTESIEDASLRMLTDAHKPMRVPAKVPGVRGPPSKIDTGRPKTKGATGARIANARDKTSFYSFMKDPSMSEQEREKLREEMKARFQPGARAVPATVRGLAALANERIEDAIARGQFKNIPRGMEIERDYNASSPFINTTEYFMNKIIQKQEIVPPWIEKQQELVSNTMRFRSRLRADWRRHVSRTIASKGGGLEKQMQSADDYALAEIRANPTKKDVEQFNTVGNDGQLSQITMSGELKAALLSDSSSPETEIKVVEQAMNDDGTLGQAEQKVTISAEQPASTPTHHPGAQPTVPPFRDSQWEQTERAYLRAAIDNLNNMTRSYNLMAPDLAKKPYFSLDRELKSCFSDVAPTVAGAIRERALAPKIKGVEVIGHTPGGVLERFAMDRAGHVYDERKPQYGFKEFWRNLFSAKSQD